MGRPVRTSPPLTIADLDHFPDDGCRYELIEGDLHVSAPAAILHQRVLQNLLMIFGHACTTPEFEVVPGPAVPLGPATLLIPDLVVAWAGTAQRSIEAQPALVVEILSPSTRRYDIGTKRPVYRDAGVGALWVVDPSEPSVTAWRWTDGGESEDQATVTDHDEAVFDWPFPVRIVPARLPEPGAWRALAT